MSKNAHQEAEVTALRDEVRRLTIQKARLVDEVSDLRDRVASAQEHAATLEWTIREHGDWKAREESNGWSNHETFLTQLHLGSEMEKLRDRGVKMSVDEYRSWLVDQSRIHFVYRQDLVAAARFRVDVGAMLHHYDLAQETAPVTA